MRIRNASLLAIVSVSAAGAQSFNIDIEPPNVGWGVGLPPSSFGGAANQPGLWNAVGGLGDTYQLWSTHGLPTGVTVETSGVGSATSADNPHASGDFAKLMEDGLRAGPTDIDVMRFNFHGLAAGRYLIYTYAGLQDYGDCCATRVQLNAFGQADVGGYPLVANTFSQGSWHGQTGGTHARQVFDLVDGAPLQIGVRNNPDAEGFDYGTITGLQLQKLPPRLYVRETAPAGGDGLSWATAFNDLQTALAQVEEWDGAVDEVWVAGGVYYPTTDGDQYVSFRVRTGLANLYGGFAGNETELSQRQLGVHPTTLSGNIGGPLSADNTNSILTMSQNIWGDDDAILDGFTILGGSGGLNGEQGWGAGLWLGGGNLTLRNCRFISNQADVGAAIYAAGGALHCVNCEFNNNSASSGGGAYATANADQIARFINCRFYSNGADNRGGAINVAGGTTTLVNCVLTGNACFMDGGAIRASDSAQVGLIGCTIVGNNSSILGGGAGGGVSVVSGASASLVNTILWENSAASAYNGTIQSQLASNGGTISANYSTVQFYLPILLPGTANNGLNPRFVNATGGDGYGGSNDDVRLSADSPLIDAGSNLGLGQDWGDLDNDGDVDEQTPLDLNLNPRRIDAPATPNDNGGFGTPVDRGAYEFQLEGCELPGNLDHDDDVDLSDLATLLGHFGTIDGNPDHGDIDSDGDIDLSDLAILLSHFGQACI